MLPYFQGFSAWLTTENVQEMLSLSFVKHVEEDSVVSLDFATEPILKAVTRVPANTQWRARHDWGQRRANERKWALTTTNQSNTYSPNAPATYADPYAAANVWDYVSPDYKTPSDGEAACIWVIDTGIFITHDEFQDGSGKSRVDLSVNFVAAPDNGTQDLNGHGTHCAGTAAGNFRGVAKKAQLRSVRVLGANGSGAWSGVIAGFDYVANNQVHGKGNIASVSLGGGATPSVDQSVNAASQLGVICVIAAGNSNNNACMDQNGNGGNSPARASEAIAVVASDSSDTVASFSSYGPCCQSIAPGVRVTSAWIPPSGSADTDYYNDISGTSMATPHVAGAIAARPLDSEWAPNEVKADLALDQTLDLIKGLTVAKASTPNRLIYALWKMN